MEKIIVVEEDPIIALDLLDMLQTTFGTAVIEHLPMPTALDSVVAGASNLLALIVERLPQDMTADIKAALARMTVVVTNFPDASMRAILPTAMFVERPFEPSSIAAMIKGRS